MNAPKVALALGGGGAKGYAHIGVAQVLAEHGFEICAIAGTSMGALVGGLLAAERLDAYTEWVSSLSQREVLRLLDPVLGGPGAIRAERVLARVDDILEDVTIEDLSIPFTAVAADLLTGREVWFQRGPLLTAIRASIALPTVITPIVVNGRLLTDGGILNPVPIEPLTPIARDLTVAVSTHGSRGVAPPVLETAEQRPGAEWVDRVRRGLLDHEALRPLLERFTADRDAGQPEEPGFAHPTGLNIFDISGLALDTMGAMIERYRIAAHPPDLMVSIPSDVCGVLDFHRAAEVITVGRACAIQALDVFLDGHPEFEVGLPASLPPAPEPDQPAEPRTADEQRIVGW